MGHTGGEHVRQAVAGSVALLRTAVDRDWEAVRAGGLEWSCRRTAAACRAPVTTTTCRQPTMAAMRATVSCSSVRRPASARSCFGTSRRLRGQNRVPEPPAMTTAV